MVSQAGFEGVVTVGPVVMVDVDVHQFQFQVVHHFVTGYEVPLFLFGILNDPAVVARVTNPPALATMRTMPCKYVKNARLIGARSACPAT